MTFLMRLTAIVGVSLTLLASAPTSAETQASVDLALVLAVDISASMDPDEQALQREGFVEAFRSPLVHSAIRNGIRGRIAVTYMEWSARNYQIVVVPWTVLDSADSASRFADHLARVLPDRLGNTSISAAIDFSVGLFDQSTVEPLRKAIDISGDGPNDSGRPVTVARDEAVTKGITINGLPVMLKRPSGHGDMEHLDLYYDQCVIGGPDAFVIPVRERQDFAEAIRSKIIREVAGMIIKKEMIQKAQAEATMDCSARANR